MKRRKNSDSDENDDDDDDDSGDGSYDEQEECTRQGRTASRPYQTRSPGGGVAEGEMLQKSPGCSGMSESGPCKPGGVDEVLRASVDEPLRDTQEVSMTRTPMLRGEKNRKNNKHKHERESQGVWKQGMSGGCSSGGDWKEAYLCIFLMLR